MGGNMSKAGAERMFPNPTTAPDVLEAIMILMRSKATVLDQAHSVNGMGSSPDGIHGNKWSRS